MLKESFVYELDKVSVDNKAKGLSVLSAIVFIIGELAGSGVLALPNALASSGNDVFFSFVMIFFMST
jgi:amino acid permease